MVNNKKTKLLAIAICAIIVVLLAGIIYEFIKIKQLEIDIERIKNSPAVECFRTYIKSFNKTLL